MPLAAPALASCPQRAPRRRAAPRRALVATAAWICLGPGVPAPALAQGAAGAEWVNWTAATPDHSRVTGTLVTGGRHVGITFEGAAFNSFVGPLPEPYFGPSSTYQSSFITGAPPLASDLIVVAGGPGTGTYRISFSEAVTDPVLAIVSLGLTNSSRTVNFQTGMFFNQPVEVLSNGANYFAGGQWTPFFVAAGGTDLYGVESSGVVRFKGTFNEITWTSPLREEEFPGASSFGTYMFTFGTAGCINYEQRRLTADARVLAGCNAYTTPGPEFIQQRRLEVQGRLRSESRYVLAGELAVQAGGRVDLFQGGHIAPAGKLEVAGRLSTSNALNVAGSLKTLPGSFATLNGLTVEPLADVRLRGSVSLGGAVSINGLLEVGDGANVSTFAPLLVTGNGSRVRVAAGGLLEATGIQAGGGATLEVGGRLRSVTGFDVTGGTVQVQPGGELSLLAGGNLFASVVNAGTLAFVAGDVTMPGGTLNNSGRLVLTRGSFTPGAAAVLNNLAGGRIEQQGGLWSLSGTGLLNQGTLQLDGGTLVLSSGTLLNTGMVQAGDGADVQVVGGSLTNSGTMVLGGRFSSGGVLSNAGQLTFNLGGGSESTGQIINNGTLRMAAPTLGGTFGNRGLLRNDATMVIEPGATLINENLLANNGTLQVDGFLELRDGGGALAQSPAGRLIVNGQVSTAAGLVIDAGSVGGRGVIDGALLLSGNSVLMPGNSPGVLTVTGRVELGTGSRLQLEIDRRGAHDTLRAREFSLAGGTVALSFVDGLVPDLDQDFALLRVTAGASGLGGLEGLPEGLLLDEYRYGDGGGERLALAFRTAEATRIDAEHFEGWSATVFADELLYADSPLAAHTGLLRVQGTLALRRDAVWHTEGPVQVEAGGRFLSSSSDLRLPERLQVAGEFVNRGQAQLGEVVVEAGGGFANEGRLVLGDGATAARLTNRGLLRHGGGNGAPASLELAAGSALSLSNEAGARAEVLADLQAPGIVGNAGQLVVAAGAALTGLDEVFHTGGQMHVDGRLGALRIAVDRALVSGRGRIDASMLMTDPSWSGFEPLQAVLRPGSEDGREAGELHIGGLLAMGYGSLLEFVLDAEGDHGELVLEGGGLFADGSYLQLVLLGDALPTEPLALTLMRWTGEVPDGLFQRVSFASRVVVRDALGDTPWDGGSWAMSLEADRLQVLLTPVPEPSTYGLMLGGLGLVGWLTRRRLRAGEAMR